MRSNSGFILFNSRQKASSRSSEPTITHTDERELKLSLKTVFQSLSHWLVQRFCVVYLELLSGALCEICKAEQTQSSNVRLKEIFILI